MKNIIVSLVPESIYFQSMLDYTLKIGQYFGSNITIVQVKEKDFTAAVSPGNGLSALKAAVQPYLGKQHHNMRFDFRILTGETKAALSALAIALNPDLLIVSTQGNRLLYRLLHGEDSIDIAQQVSCPVMLIPPGDNMRLTRRVVYTTEFAKEDLDNLRMLQDWGAVFGASLLCLHICREGSEVAAAREKMEGFKSRFASRKFEYQIIIGDITESIRGFVKLDQSDLIVGLHHRRSWWAAMLRPSITRNIALHASIPMLIFKEQ